METTQDLGDIWGEFEDIVDKGSIPVLPTRTASPSTRPLNPKERLAYWLAGGQGVFLTSIFIVFVGFDKGLPLIITLLCGLLLWAVWVCPLLGSSPMKRPLVMGLLTTISVLLLSVPMSLTQHALDSYREGAAFWNLFVVSHTLEETIEWSASPATVLAVSLSLVVGLLFNRRLLQRQPWIPNTARPLHRGRLLLSFAFMVVVFLVPLVFVWVTSLRVEHLGWLDSAIPRADSVVSTPQYAEGIGLQNPLLDDYWKANPILRLSDLREMKDEEFLEILRAVNQQIGSPGYQPSHEDSTSLFPRLARRILYLDTPRAEAAEFMAALLLFDDRFGQYFPEYWAKALRQQTLPLIASETSLVKLEHWHKRFSSFSHATGQSITLVELDAIAAHAAQRDLLFVSEERPLHLYGAIKTRHSLTFYLRRLRAQLFLLDYDRHRKQFVESPAEEFRDGGSRLLETFWFDKTNFYNQLASERTRIEKPDIYQAALLALVHVRKHKLTHGAYPEPSQVSLPSELIYTSNGSTAVLGTVEHYGLARRPSWKQELR